MIISFVLGCSTVVPPAEDTLSVAIVAPTEEQLLGTHAPVVLAAQLAGADLLDTVLTWHSDLNGVLVGELVIEDDRALYTLPNGLLAGDHLVMVSAVAGAQSASDTGVVRVITNEPPTVEITAPLPGSLGKANEATALRAVVSDPDGESAGLTLLWEGVTIALPTDVGPDGVIETELLLGAGAYTLVLNAVDPLAASATASVSFEMVDEVDTDGDGFDDLRVGGEDCDDTDPEVHPAAAELCDEIDNDCDGTIDDDYALDAGVWFADFDGDGFGDPDNSHQACRQPTGFVANQADCDDLNAERNPSAVEVCDTLDNDCDGDVDEGAVDASVWYLDADGDGFGRASITLLGCEQPDAYASDASDCDDLSADSYPGAAEWCDLRDNDCNGAIDEGVLLIFYADDDGDGHGAAGSAAEGCSPATGYVLSDDDCDDDDATVFTAAVEVCDGADNDCDGLVDDDPLDPSLWYADVDGDGFGIEPGEESCDAPSGFSATKGDCDDGDAGAFPGADERCNDEVLHDVTSFPP